jgi:putative spermidine/putrescine transport system permease protein
MRTPPQRFLPLKKFKPIALFPFFGFVLLFLVWPAISLFRLAIQPTKDSDISAMREAITGDYLDSFIYTIKLSVLTALLGVLLGSLLAASVMRIERPKWFRNFMTSFAGVAANLGGIPLAFAFIAALGTQGLITKMIDYFGINLADAGFRISNFAGITIVYFSLWFRHSTGFVLLGVKLQQALVPLLGNTGAT